MMYFDLWPEPLGNKGLIRVLILLQMEEKNCCSLLKREWGVHPQRQKTPNSYSDCKRISRQRQLVCDVSEALTAVQTWTSIVLIFICNWIDVGRLISPYRGIKCHIAGQDRRHVLQCGSMILGRWWEKIRTRTDAAVWSQKVKHIYLTDCNSRNHLLREAGESLRRTLDWDWSESLTVTS